MATRRQFIFNTVAAAAAVTGLTYVIVPTDNVSDNAETAHFLTAHDQLIVAAFLPVLLAGYLDKAALAANWQATLLHNVDQAIALQRPGVQAELRQLFDLLAFKLSRVALTQSATNWNDMPAHTVDQMLLAWRNNALDLLQTAYSGLHDLVIAAYFVEPSSWPNIGYEPPPALRGS